MTTIIFIQWIILMITPDDKASEHFERERLSERETLILLIENEEKI